jgi:hypothetical protein
MAQIQKPTPDQIWLWIQSLQLDFGSYPNSEALFDAIWQEVLKLRQEQPTQD